uniref:glycosyltransferase n=1 Tax=Alistipes shahii TaxID=328814 RepID=UPI003FED620D
MKWYSKYLPVYEKPFAEVPAETVAEVRAKLAERQSDRPLATVSVIACNEEKRLTACLWSLAEQRCRYPMEIIATDNLSKDRTAEIFETLGLPWQRETTPGCGHARLCGLNRARGKYHINIDADTIYPPRYVETMVDALARDTHLWLQSFQRPELSVRGLVFAYDTELARKVGIRTDIIRGEDGSLALGLKPYGRIAFVRSRRARAVTGYGTVSKDGTLLDSFRVRAVKALKGLGGMFFKKSEYKDEEDNLLK